MQRITSSTRLIDGNGAGKDGFSDGDAGAGIPRTALIASWCNSVQEELCGLVERAGVTLNGASNTQLQTVLFKPPTIQKFTSGSGNYTTPTGVVWINVLMVGGGGAGGGGTEDSASPGANGSAATAGATTFGGTLLVANGGAPGGGGSATGANIPGASGTGGTATISGTAIGRAMAGADGDHGILIGAGDAFGTNGSHFLGGRGGSTWLGPGGSGGGGALGLWSGKIAGANTGAGGGGGGTCPFSGSTKATSGGGGGGGGQIDAIVFPTAVNQVFAYQVGNFNGGGVGVSTTSDFHGASGSSGYIEVREYYK